MCNILSLSLFLSPSLPSFLSLKSPGAVSSSGTPYIYEIPNKDLLANLTNTGADHKSINLSLSFRVKSSSTLVQQSAIIIDINFQKVYNYLFRLFLPLSSLMLENATQDINYLIQNRHVSVVIHSGE